MKTIQNVTIMVTRSRAELEVSWGRELDIPSLGLTENYNKTKLF